MKYLIGLSGKPGSGKGTVARLISEITQKAGYSTGVVRSSEPLENAIKIFDVIPNRPDLQQLFVFLSQRYGPDIVARGGAKRIREIGADIMIFDAVRMLSDEAMVRTFDPAMIICVDAKPEVRWLRIRARNSRPGDADKTWEQFLEEDNAPTERDFEEIKSRADRIIDNNGSLKALEQQVADAFNIVHPRE